MKRIIEIKAFENGGHRNQTSDYIKIIPEGYAVIPDDMETPNFPFGEVTVEEINGIPTVTKWIPVVIPAIPEPIKTVTADDILNALIGGDK